MDQKVQLCRRLFRRSSVSYSSTRQYYANIEKTLRRYQREYYTIFFSLDKQNEIIWN